MKRPKGIRAQTRSVEQELVPAGGYPWGMPGWEAVQGGGFARPGLPSFQPRYGTTQYTHNLPPMAPSLNKQRISASQ